jgi:Methyltransferase domain
MTEFDKAWKWARNRGTFQQEYSELKHVFDLMKACNCKSYLEVGCAEGNSLYILSHASDHSEYIDIDEDHTRKQREEAIAELGRPVGKYHGDSANPSTHPRNRKYDCVLIDGGHDYTTVLSDSAFYGTLATKYIFWHDVQLPEVKRAVDYFVASRKLGKYTQFINSSTFGYGIMELGK